MINRLDSIQESHAITSLCLSADDRCLLVNVNTLQEIHIYDMQTRKLVGRLSGYKQVIADILRFSCIDIDICVEYVCDSISVRWVKRSVCGEW